VNGTGGLAQYLAGAALGNAVIHLHFHANLIEQVSHSHYTGALFNGWGGEHSLLAVLAFVALEGQAGDHQCHQKEGHEGAASHTVHSFRVVVLLVEYYYAYYSSLLRVL